MWFVSSPAITQLGIPHWYERTNIFRHEGPFMVTGNAKLEDYLCTENI